MGFLKGIIRGVKELSAADDENRLEEYIGGKVSNLVNSLDGSDEEAAITMRDSQLEKLRELLNDDEFDNDSFQEQVDEFISNSALVINDVVVALWRGAQGWERDFDLYDNYTESDEFDSITDDEKENIVQALKNANDQIIKRLDDAFEVCRNDEDTELIETWVCVLWSMKAKRLHWMGKNVEAVRLAIRALPYACDEDEKNLAKAQITGKREDLNGLHFVNIGYGIVNVPIEQRIKNARDWWLEDYEKMSEEDKAESLKYFEEAKYDILHGQSTFNNRPYHDRQFIFTVRDLDHIGGCYDETDTIQYVFPLDEMPGDISFPVGHPQPNTLYYAHPLRPYYMPFEKAQITLLYEKVQEICRLFQCLGATEITTRCLKGEKVSSNLNYSDSMNGQVNYKVASMSGGMNRKMSSQENQSKKNEMSLTQTFSPTQMPYCPDDLLWAKEDPEIQTFIKQRLNGGLLEFTKRVSSYETSNISQNQIMDVKAAFSALINNVSANYNQSSDSTFDSTNETEWEISVKFKPMEEFGNNIQANIATSFEVSSDSTSPTVPSSLTANEEKYLEEIEFALEDGGIGESERKFLEHKRIKLGISPERAAELEASFSKALVLTEDEQEYLELYKEYVEVGKITDSVRRLLDRELKSLGISKERAEEIEATIV